MYKTRWRYYVVVALALLLVIAVSPQTSLAQDEMPDEEAFYPSLPDATFGQAVMASNLRESTLFTEPMIMWVSVIGLPSLESAEEAFETTSSHIETYAEASGDREHEQVSIGQTGDESLALYNDGGNDYPHSMLSVVRTGPNLMIVWGISLADGLPADTSELLQGFIDGATDDPATLVPTLRTLPPGWGFVDDQPSDILRVLHRAEATPVGT